jgi:hypothetical protein
MTLAQLCEQRGYEIGYAIGYAIMQQGIEQSIQQIDLKLLKRGMSLQEVAELLIVEGPRET